MRHIAITFQRIAAHLKHGGVIAYPTESCYGFGCDPRNRAAVQRLLRLKQRPQRKGLILIASSYHQVARFIEALTPAEQLTLKNEGAQAITCLMPALPSCPRWLRGAHDTLGVRITAHPGASALCRALGMALVSTSANIRGDRPTRSYGDCSRRFGREVLVLPGRIGRRKRPSTIRTWADGRIVRK